MTRQKLVPINEQTSALMSRVKQRRTKPEETVAAALRMLGSRYRRNVRSLPGSPDFSNRSKGWAIQVHGCFWHNHDCKRGTVPVHNAEFWIEKLEANRVRDQRTNEALSASGMNVLTIWECETKDPVVLAGRMEAFIRNTEQEFGAR